jgi:hypothetical protein
MEINNLENNIEIKSITKIGTEYNTKKFNFTQNNQKLCPKEDEIEIKRIKMKKFSSTNNNFKLSKDKIISNHNNIMHRQNTFNKLKNKKKEFQKQINKQIKGQKSTIITPNQNLVANANSNIDIIDAEGHVTNINGIKNVLVTVQDFTLYTSGDHQNELASYVGKAIRDITFTDGKAYVAMGYGFAVIDETTLTMVKSHWVRRPNVIYSATRVGDKLVLLTNSYIYYGDPESTDPLKTFQKVAGSFADTKMYPINDHAVFVFGPSKLNYCDFSSGTPVLTSLVSAKATSVQKSATGYIANFAGQSYYYTIDETGQTATKQGSAAGFATADPNGDGTVWINDANGLHLNGSTVY